MKFGVRRSDIHRDLTRARSRFMKDLDRAARIATDRATRDAQRDLREKIRSVGLGRLGNAVGQTSALKLRQNDRNPYGVIYAKGGDESRAGGALESYSQGSTIRARQTKWLAFPTNAVPRYMMINGRRGRTTAAAFAKSGMVTSIGKLEFRPVNSNMALLVIRKVTLSPKTGRAKAAGPGRTRTRIPVNEVVAFVLIRETRRAQRFNKNVIVRRRAKHMPQYMVEALAEIKRSGGGR